MRDGLEKTKTKTGKKWAGHPRKNRRSLESTAYHEAGHAVDDVRFGFNPDKTSIKAACGTAGRSHTLDGWNDEIEVGYWIISLLAGYAAELKFGASESLVRAGARDDFE